MCLPLWTATLVLALCPQTLSEPVWDVLSNTLEVMRAIGGTTEAKYAELSVAVPVTARLGVETGSVRATRSVKVEAKRLYLGRNVPPGWTRSQVLFNYRLYLKDAHSVGVESHLGPFHGSFERTWADASRYLIYVPEPAGGADAPRIHPWHPSAIPPGTLIEWQQLDEQGPKLEAGLDVAPWVRVDYFDRQTGRAIRQLWGIAFLEENTVLVYRARPGTTENKSVQLFRLGVGAGRRTRAGAGAGFGALHRSAHRLLEGYRLSLDDQTDRETYYQFLRTGEIVTDLEPERFDRSTTFDVLFAGVSADASAEASARLGLLHGAVGGQVNAVVGPLARVVYRKDEVHYEDYTSIEQVRLFDDTAVRVVTTLDEVGNVFDRTVELTLFDVHASYIEPLAATLGVEPAPTDGPVDFVRFVWTESELYALQDVARQRMPELVGAATIERWTGPRSFRSPTSLTTSHRFVERLFVDDDPLRALFETLSDINFSNNGFVEGLLLLPNVPMYDFIQGTP